MRFENRRYVRWSWLTYLATTMWSLLLINDWYNDKNGAEYFMEYNRSLMEDLTQSFVTETKNKTSQSCDPIPKLETKFITNPAAEDIPKIVELLNKQRNPPIVPPTKERDKIAPEVPDTENIQIKPKVLDRGNQSEKELENDTIQSQSRTADEASEVPPLKLNPNRIPLTSLSIVECLWNALAFIISVATCILIRSILNSLYKRCWKKKPIIRLEDFFCETPIENHSEPETQFFHTTLPRKCSKIPTFIRRRTHSELDLKNPLQSEGISSPCLLLRPCISELKTQKEKRKLHCQDSIFGELMHYKKKLNAEEKAVLKLRDEMITMHKEREREQDQFNLKLQAVLVQKRELNKQLTSVIKESRLFKTELDEIMAAKTQIEHKLQYLKQEFKKASKERNVMKKEVLSLQGENENLKQSLETCRCELRRNEQTVIQLEKEISHLKSRLQCVSMRNKRKPGTYRRVDPIIQTEKPERLVESSSSNSLAPKDVLNEIPLKREIKQKRPASYSSSNSVHPVNGNIPEADLEVTREEGREIYDNIQTRLRKLEHNIEQWENADDHQSSNDDRVKVAPRFTPRVKHIQRDRPIERDDGLEIAEIFLTCCDNSNDESSEYGLTSDSCFKHLYRKKRYKTDLTGNVLQEILETSPIPKHPIDDTTSISSTAITSSSSTTPIASHSSNISGNTDHAELEEATIEDSTPTTANSGSTNDEVIDSNLTNELERLMASLERSGKPNEDFANTITKKQTMFLKKYFEQGGKMLNAEGDFESLTNFNKEKYFGGTTAAGCILYPDESDEKINRHLNNASLGLHNVFTNFESWQNSKSSSTSRLSTPTYNKPPSDDYDSSLDEQINDLSSLD